MITNELLSTYSIISSFKEAWASIILSPPGSGKTSLIIHLFKNLETPKNIILVAPLRAIISELGERFCKENNVEVILSGDSDCKERTSKRLSEGEKLFILTTPESLGLEFLDKLKRADTIFILDEIHLFHYWGESFRPYLNYFFQEIVTRGFSIIGLTATFEKEFFEKFLCDLKNNYGRVLVFNLGNQQLLHSPTKTSDFSWFGLNYFRGFVIKKILRTKDGETSLIFCRSRQEVKRWKEFFDHRGILALGCVGGEVPDFQKELNRFYETKKRPSVIISTLALSHGVNLPPIRHVFICYKVLIKDFYIQMVGRGGRDGKGYELYLFKSRERKIQYFLNALLKVFGELLRFRVRC